MAKDHTQRIDHAVPDVVNCVATIAAIRDRPLTGAGA